MDQKETIQTQGKSQFLVASASNFIFKYRHSILIVLGLVTAFLFYQATRVKIDAGFEKLLPLKHHYMKTFMQYQDSFGGANRILISIKVKDGDMFRPDFFKTLKQVTDEVFYISGVNRSQVTSLFTPNVRYTEVVEDGFSGGNVIPADFQPTDVYIQEVKENILKAGIVGRLVANDFSGAIVSATLLEHDPSTGSKLDYQQVAKALEHIRQSFETEQIQIQIIGFAKMIGDIADGAAGVVVFFAVAFMITALLVYAYCRNWKLTCLPLMCSIVAVIWQLGLLRLFGFGIDPMSILVPFLVFAIGVSHGIQMINRIKHEVIQGVTTQVAAKNSFESLLVPGGIALISDTIGFLTILLIEIRIIQELAITASLGVAAIIVTNLLLMPLLVTLLNLSLIKNQKENLAYLTPLWVSLSKLTLPKPAVATILICIGLTGVGLWKASALKIGDLQPGVPELRQDSRYNLDTKEITSSFSIGVDILTLIGVTSKDGCVNFDVMSVIDDMAWRISNIDGVKSVITLPFVSKVINAGYNEGFPKWRVLPQSTAALAQTMTFIETSSGLLNRDCDAIPIYIFTLDHKAETIDHIIQSTKHLMHKLNNEEIEFKLATGNVGVMAATNEAVSQAQMPMFIYLYLAIFILCWMTFKSLKATACVILPLALVSILANALMVILEIGLKVSTLPVIALGVGIGVDYGIYIYSRLVIFLEQGLSLTKAYVETLKATGNAVVFTGFTLAISVSTWIFSDLKFQADMGILLTFMFLVNMIASIVMIPALAALLKPYKAQGQ